MNCKIFIILLAVAALFSCENGAPEEQASNYKTLTVKKEDRTMRQEYSARLEGQQVVEIRPQVSGLITDICIGEGQKVKKGQTLFIIDQVLYRAALEEAEANVKSAESKLATARLNYESTQMLRDRDVVQDFDLSTARNELASAEAAVAQAKALEVNARNNLSFTEVKSPVNGVAGMIAYRVGSLVSSNISTPLVTVTDDSRIYAYFSISEGQVIDLMERCGSLDKFMENMSDVRLRMAGGKMYEHAGRIAAVSGIVNAGTGAVTLRADFPNPQSLLRSGGSASVVVPTELTQVIVIPQSATYELQDRRFAYKVVDGRTQSVPLTLYRLNNGTEYVVEDGLQPGDVIIAEGAGLVKEGVAVCLQNEKE